MVVHIGLDAWFGTLEIYDHEKKKSISFPQMFNEFENIDVIENVRQVFEKVKYNVKKGNKYGNVGIQLFTNLDTPNRKKLIEIAKTFGFSKVVFTNGFIGEYLNAMLQSNIAPKNDNIIWTFNSPDLFIWIKYCGKANYYKRFENVKCSTSEDLIEIQERCELAQPPHLIVYSSNFPIEKNIIKKAFPNCQISKFNGTIKPAKAALTKARILANHLAVKEFDINPMLDDDVNVKVNKDIIITFKAGENLPSQKNVHIDLYKNERKLNVFINEDLFQIIDVKFSMTTFADFLIYFFIDEDGMYKLNYLEMNPLYKIERFWKNLYENNEKGLNFDEFHKIPRKLNVYDENINGVGIDLGTSKCCMAVNRQNGIKTVALDKNGEKFLPSYVAFDENEETPKCGQIAKNELKIKSKLTVFDSKRFMGRQIKDIKIDKTWPFEVKDIGDRTTIYFPGTGIQKAPEEVAAVLLKNLKRKVEELFHGKELEDVAVAVPSTFSSEQKISVLTSTYLGTWKGVCLIPENVATMFAYFIAKPVLDDTTVLLFDLGGGKLDVSIFKIFEKNKMLRTICNSADLNLGGRDFDQILFDYFTNVLRKRHKIDIMKNDEMKYLLLEKCMEIKHNLSERHEDQLDVNNFNPNIEEYISITRKQFEAMSKSLLSKIDETFRNIFDNICIYSYINKILLIGGSSRMPMIKRILEDIFPDIEHCYPENSDELIAIGAAHYAYSLLSPPSSEPEPPQTPPQRRRKKCSVM